MCSCGQLCVKSGDFWEQVPLVYKKDNYQVHVRECQMDDITEIDTFNELKAIDKLYVTG